MSLSLLKKTIPKQKNEDLLLPIKRERTTNERYHELIQNEIDNRLFRPQKVKKTTKKDIKEPFNQKPILEILEDKIQKTIPKDNYSNNLRILQRRNLSDKYIKLLVQPK